MVSTSEGSNEALRRKRNSLLIDLTLQAFWEYCDSVNIAKDGGVYENSYVRRGGFLTLWIWLQQNVGKPCLLCNGGENRDQKDLI